MEGQILSIQSHVDFGYFGEKLLSFLCNALDTVSIHAAPQPGPNDKYIYRNSEAQEITLQVIRPCSFDLSLCIYNCGSDEWTEENASKPVDSILWIHIFLQGLLWGILFCQLKLHCQDYVGSRPVDLDIGLPLAALYPYSQEEFEEKVVQSRMHKTEKEKTVKEKGSKPIQGSMVLDNPTARIPGQRPTVTIPSIFLRAIAHKFYPPLNWFTDDRLEFAQHRLHELHTKLIRPEPTVDYPSPEKILVFDTAKMITLWGSDETYSCLSPLKWQEATTNLLAALVTLSESLLTEEMLIRFSFSGEFEKHRKLFPLVSIRARGARTSSKASFLIVATTYNRQPRIRTLKFFGNRFDLPLPKVGFKGHMPINAGIGGVLAVISLPSLVGIVPPLAVSLLPAPSMSFRYISQLV
ncbi:hypothetical protein BT96DRAFT_976204 [Gymnopus androsaceus JB14]|uniref:Uncharacterized protein n=1 Tax=Gymnopus androsaceus JB14 TaxID=1447944 RepID=A0A6A4HQ59_9AGAR|nr:hypothetical protein BT96DRAFT_976204 [Gymnopus androsaceus JB14]